METIFATIALFIGLGFLVTASNLAVKLAVRFSEVTGMMRLSVGMIIVSVMTSLPEFSIAIVSSISGASGIMFGNLLGASVTDLLLVFGAGALAFGLRIKKDEIIKAFQIIIITIAAISYGVFYGFGIISGIASLLLFGFFARNFLVFNSHNHPEKWQDILGGLVILAKLAAVIIVVLLSAELITLSVKTISDASGISQTVIGATLISVCTTLPELAVTLAAGRKKEYDLLFGNIFGSCFVNIMLIMGIGTIISPAFFTFREILLFAALCIAFLISYLFALGKEVDRFQGAILLSFYALYVFAIMYA